MFNTKNYESRVEKSLDRMSLWSTIPLNTGTEDESPPPRSCLDMKFEAFTKTYSDITNAMDGVVALDRKQKKHAVLPPFQCQHSKTDYNYGYRSPPDTKPDPCTYNPNFNATLPSTTASKLPKNIVNKPEKNYTETSEIQGTHDISSVEDVVTAFQRNIRDFSTSNITLNDKYSSDVDYNPFPVHTTTLPKNKKRDLTPISETSNVEFYDPPPAPAPPSTDFYTQLDRKELFMTDIGREYPKAVSQLDGLKPRVKVKELGPKLKNTRTPRKMSRVEFLDSLAKERREFISELTDTFSPKTRSLQTQAQKIENKRPKSNFEFMRPREELQFPNQHEVIGEPKIPIDRDKVNKKEIPRKTKIHKSPQDLRGRDFWTKSTYKY